MLVTIDSAGRLVIPKVLRQRLGLRGGQELEIAERDGRIEIVPRPTPMTLVGDGDDVAAVPEAPLPPLTDEMVREALEQSRR